jgi:MFS family permease
VRAAAVVGVIGVAMFGLVERRARDPLLRPSWLARREVGGPVAMNLFAHITLMGLSVTSPFLLQRLFGYGTGAVALLTGIRPAAFSLAASMSARHARSMGTRRVLLTGNAVLTIGCVLTAVGVLQHSIVVLVASIVLTGFGVGYGRPSLVAIITDAVDDGDAGIANGVLSMAGQLGSSIGQTLLVAIIGTGAGAAAFANSAWAAAVSALLAIAMTALLIGRDGRTRVRHRQASLARRDDLSPSTQ